MAEWVKIMIQLYAAYKPVTDRLKVKPRKKKWKKIYHTNLTKRASVAVLISDKRDVKA